MIGYQTSVSLAAGTSDDAAILASCSRLGCFQVLDVNCIRHDNIDLCPGCMAWCTGTDVVWSAVLTLPSVYVAAGVLFACFAYKSASSIKL